MFFHAGKLVSVHIKKHDGLPGSLILYLEYFDTVQTVKEGIYLDKNMRVPRSQQQLFLEEELLDDSQTLSQCGIEDGSQVIIKGNCVVLPRVHAFSFLILKVNTYLSRSCSYQVIQHIFSCPSKTIGHCYKS